MSSDGIAELWAQGGTGMYLLTLLGMGALGCSVVLPILAMAKKGQVLIFAVLLATFGMVLIGTGFGQEALAMSGTDQALMNVNPADKEIIRLVGQSEAMVLRLYGLFLALIPLGAAAFTTALAVGKGENDKPAPAALGIGAVAALVIVAGGAFGVHHLNGRRVALAEQSREMLEKSKTAP